VVYGMNAIVVFMASEQLMYFMDRFHWRPWLYDHAFSRLGLHVGSLAYGLAMCALWWGVCWVLWRRRIFVKI
jgi:predicted acyltransferase